MRYSMKQKILAAGDDFEIKDENGQRAFYVDGYAFSIGKKLSFQDKHGQELMMIRQKLFTFCPTFRVLKHGKQVARLRKSPFGFRDNFKFEIPGSSNISIVGKLLEHEYVFSQNKKEIASVSKKYFRDSDTYGIEIQEGNHAMILCGVVMVDLICHKGR